MARKTLKVPEDLFHALDEDKDDQQSWPHYLEQQCLHDDGVDEERAELVEDIRDQLDRLDDDYERPESAPSITYDDVKAACSAAVRDELPEELR